MNRFEHGSGLWYERETPSETRMQSDRIVEVNPWLRFTGSYRQLSQLICNTLQARCSELGDLTKD